MKSEYKVGDRVELLKDKPEYGWKKGKKLTIYYVGTCDKEKNSNPWVEPSKGEYLVRVRDVNHVVKYSEVALRRG